MWSFEDVAHPTQGSRLCARCHAFLLTMVLKSDYTTQYFVLDNLKQSGKFPLTLLWVETAF